MPEVGIDRDVNVSIDQLWRAVLDVERYPDMMASVRAVRIAEVEPSGRRRVEWSVLLKGSVLEWEEIEQIDHQSRAITFHQVDGDLERLQGAWRLTEVEKTTTRIRLEVSFEIGIPLVADMLNPVAERAFYENCAEMLQAIERDVAL